MRKFIMRSVVVLAVVAAGFAGWLYFTEATAANLPPLKAGDLIFQTSTSSQSLAILLASNSAYSHMGMIEFAANGEPMVLEAAGPVRSVPLNSWIKHGLGHRITIKRYVGLTEEVATDILRAAHKYDGLPYDIFFLPDKDHIYCSEIVRLAYSEGANVDIGKMQKVSELNLDNFAARKVIARRWKKDPICQSTDETFESCFAKVQQQELITPQSIADDTNLQTIFTNFGSFAR